DNAADIRLNAMWGIVFSTLSPMYEFSHSLGHKRTNHRWPKSIAVRFGPKADIRRGIGTTGCTALQRERDMCAVQCPRNIAFTARLWLVGYLAAFRVFQYGRTRDIDR